LMQMSPAIMEKRSSLTLESSCGAKMVSGCQEEDGMHGLVHLVRIQAASQVVMLEKAIVISTPKKEIKWISNVQALVNLAMGVDVKIMRNGTSTVLLGVNTVEMME